jgi:hypothetical protein
VVIRRSVKRRKRMEQRGIDSRICSKKDEKNKIK